MVDCPSMPHAAFRLNTMRRVLIILVIVVFIALSAGVLFYFRSRPSSSGIPGEGYEPTPLLPPPPSHTTTIPPGDRLTLQGPRGSVSVQNFYPKAIATADQSVLLEDTSPFSIVYVPALARFIVTVRGESRAQALANREAAETALLRLLGIDTATACRLNVEEDIDGPGELEFSQNAGLPLSFCTTPATH